MNIRTTLLISLGVIFVSEGSQLNAMDKSLKDLADHTAQAVGKELEKAGKEITKTLPTKIDLEFSPRNLCGTILGVTGAVAIYKGLSQLLNTWGKTDAALQAEHVDRQKSYKVGLIKVIAGILSLGGSYAAFYWK